MTQPTTPRWERIADPAPARGPALMDALLTPHRSLSARAFLLVMCVFSGMNVLVALFWALQGAWPVLGFLVLDTALLAVAFGMNFRSGQMFERVRIDADVVHITRQPVRGRASHWVVNPSWARVEDRPDVVRIAAGDRAVHVGRFLSPPERGDLAAALRAALACARLSPATSRP